MAVAHNLGFPHIGGDRELKKAVEAYWKDDINDVDPRLKVPLHSQKPKVRLSTW